MDFSLTEDQKNIQKMVRGFVDNEIIPIAQETDKLAQFPADTFRKMSDLGLLGMLVPEEYGGTGADFLSFVLALEEIARGCAATALSTAQHVIFSTDVISRFGSDEQKRRFLPAMATGERIGAWAITEPGAGSDASNLRTIAVKEGDSYVLNGQKMFITNAAVASVFVVVASTNPEAGSRGLSLFVVERDTPGFTVGPPLEKCGLKGSPTSELWFDDVRIPSANLLGTEGNGWKMAMSILSKERAAVTALNLGLAEAALEASLRYAKERVQFGQPIANYQAIQIKLADMATEIEASRLLLYYTVYLWENGLSADKLSSMAKLFSSETAMRASLQAVQIHGGYGYMREYGVERLMRDAKVGEIGGGTSEIQRMVISSLLLKEKS